MDQNNYQGFLFLIIILYLEIEFYFIKTHEPRKDIKMGYLVYSYYLN